MQNAVGLDNEKHLSVFSVMLYLQSSYVHVSAVLPSQKSHPVSMLT